AVDIQIDGAITTDTAPKARAAGANVFVAGTAIFGAPDPPTAAEALRTAIEKACQNESASQTTIPTYSRTYGSTSSWRGIRSRRPWTARRPSRRRSANRST